MAGPKAGAVDVTPRSRGDDPSVARYKLYRNPDRTYSAILSTGPIHYQSTPAGPWLDKKQRFVAGGTRTNEQRSIESDVAMATWETGAGANRRWWVEFKETLTGRGIQFRLDYQPTPVAGTNELRFTDASGGVWSYFHTRTGSKMLGPSTPAAVAVRTYGPFPYVLLPTTPPLEKLPDGSIRCGEVFTMARPHINGADGFGYAQTEWLLDEANQTLSFAIDDAGLPASAFPYRVDPSTQFAVASSSNDQAVYRQGATYPPTTATSVETSTYHVSASRYLSGTDYIVRNGFIRWDTSPIPDDATIAGATLRAYSITAHQSNADGRNLTADWYGWVPDVTVSDYTATPGTDAILGISISSLAEGGDNDIALSGAAINVSKTGFTGIRLHVDGGQPAGLNVLSFAAYDDATLTEPRLLVDYSIPDYIQVGADGAGKKKRTQTHTVSGQTVHTGYDAQADYSSGGAARVLNAPPASGDYAVATRRIDAQYGRPRTERHFVATGITGNDTTATLLSLTPYNDYVAGAAANNFLVTTGKVFVPEYLIITNRVQTATTIFWGRLELRVNISGTVLATSPLVAFVTAPATAAVVGAGSTATIRFFEYLEIPSGASFGLTKIDSGGTANRVNFDVALGGFEI